MNDFFLFQFIAHPNCQQVLSAEWEAGYPGWEGMSSAKRFAVILVRMVMLPLIAIFYLIAPKSKMALNMIRWAMFILGRGKNNSCFFPVS